MYPLLTVRHTTALLSEHAIQPVLRENPLQFEVVDHIGAGAVSDKKLGSFQAVRIMTGAQIPEGADAVVMLELTKTFSEDGKNYMVLKRSLQPGENISKTGEDARKGSVLVKKEPG